MYLSTVAVQSSTLLPVPCLPIGPSQEIPTRTSAISHLRLSRRSQEVHPAGGGQAKDAGSRHAAAAAAAATAAADGLVGHEGGGEEEEQRRGAMNFEDVLLGPIISREKSEESDGVLISKCLKSCCGN